jgi:hypothetical protein
MCSGRSTSTSSGFSCKVDHAQADDRMVAAKGADAYGRLEESEFFWLLGNVSKQQVREILRIRVALRGLAKKLAFPAIES